MPSFKTMTLEQQKESKKRKKDCVGENFFNVNKAQGEKIFYDINLDGFFSLSHSNHFSLLPPKTHQCQCTLYIIYVGRKSNDEMMSSKFYISCDNILLVFVVMMCQ
jgi:hypothetical protein